MKCGLKLIGVLLLSALFGYGCSDSDIHIIKDVKITSIKEDACINSKCVYSMVILKDVKSFNFKINDEFNDLLKEGMVVSLAYNKDLHVTDIITP